MKTISSVSGGRTSAYTEEMFPADYRLFSLVRTENKKDKFPDKKIRKLVEDRIQKPFIATAEDNLIIYTMLDLEQYWGREIVWVSGITFDEVIRSKGGLLPNKLHRYCTTWMKITPMFYWWAENIGEPVKMQIGFRANEGGRVTRMLEKTNEKGLLTFDATFEKHESGRNKGQNKWENVEWQMPVFPLHFDRPTYKDRIVEYWKDKPVRFAEKNNCVHCFHQNPLMLKAQFERQPEKMCWAKKQEGGDKGYWRSDISYEDIERSNVQSSIPFAEFDECESGHCEF